MKSLFVAIFFLILDNFCCQSVKYLQNVIIPSHEGMLIRAPKSAAHMQIKNLSFEKVVLNSPLKVPDYILSKSEFSYVLPKKGYIYFYNYSASDITIQLDIESKKQFIIEKLKTK
ncbi:hypothetical protein OK18_07940 [Chryseobacterium gallinarum]|uniref:Uncharacterized protein n=1 Tax=Chryseobacterium gallinarum TaxID=1324352 RepID=A0A0G3M092_CHRGL|nr:hypothetical protein [Chryseobacterium gallinarum]AKK72566.1 hypothetical protein OK18_07940 [Chryseobacterium gallinarum]